VPDYFIAEENRLELLFGLDASAVFAQTIFDEKETDFERIERGKPVELALRRPRAPVSVKSFLFPVKERVAVYPSTTYRWRPEPDAEHPALVAGARACDIEALKILDSVFIQEDFVDPFYSIRRDALRLVTVDCAAPAPSCFCNLLGSKPYAQQGFDVNLAPIEGGYVVEEGSQKGKEMLVASMKLLREASADELAARDAARAAAEGKLAEQNAQFATEQSFQEIASASVDSERWLDLASDCVECGSCSNICPTCHCFQLYDQPSDDQAGPHERIKVWDSCLLSSYAKMAGVGGMKATPRPELRQRFANRLIHKFAWFPQNMTLLGCVGCGRCIDACLGGCDLRQLLKDLALEGVS